MAVVWHVDLRPAGPVSVSLQSQHTLPLPNWIRNEGFVAAEIKRISTICVVAINWNVAASKKCFDGDTPIRFLPLYSVFDDNALNHHCPRPSLMFSGLRSKTAGHFSHINWNVLVLLIPGIFPDIKSTGWSEQCTDDIFQCSYLSDLVELLANVKHLRPNIPS